MKYARYFGEVRKNRANKGISPLDANHVEGNVFCPAQAHMKLTNYWMNYAVCEKYKFFSPLSREKFKKFIETGCY